MHRQYIYVGTTVQGLSPRVRKRVVGLEAGVNKALVLQDCHHAYYSLIIIFCWATPITAPLSLCLLLLLVRSLKRLMHSAAGDIFL
jgi:hypothetical protein